MNHEADPRTQDRGRAVLTGLSHELRAPLQTLLGHLDLLGSEALGALSSEQSEAVAAATRSAERILSIARDVLEVARMDAGRETARKDNVDVSALLQAERDEATEFARARGLALELDCPGALTMCTDGAKLSRIVANLLSNALKYTETGSVWIQAGAEGGWGFVEVTDTGPGIPKDQHEAVFSEYVRLHDDPTGTGLGLSIVRRLADLLGGRVTLASRVGEGTRVRLDLPL